MVNPALLLSTATATSLITGIDWLVIAIYFSVLLGVVWWGVRSAKDSAADYFLAGRQSELVDHWRLNLCLEHRIETGSRVGACWCWPGCLFRSICGRCVGPWRLMNCTPGAYL